MFPRLASRIPGTILTKNLRSNQLSCPQFLIKSRFSLNRTPKGVFPSTEQSIENSKTKLEFLSKKINEDRIRLEQLSQNIHWMKANDILEYHNEIMADHRISIVVPALVPPSVPTNSFGPGSCLFLILCFLIHPVLGILFILVC